MADLLMRECGGDLWGPDGKLLLAGMKPVAGLLPPAAAAAAAEADGLPSEKHQGAREDEGDGKDIIAILVGFGGWGDGGREGGAFEGGRRNQEIL